MNFDINVNVQTAGADKIDALEKKIKSLQKETVKIKIDPDVSNLSNIDTSKIKKTMQTQIDKASKDATKVVNAKISAEQKAAKEIAKIQRNESSLYTNPYKEAYQSIGRKSDIQTEMSAYYKNMETESVKQAKSTAKIIKDTQKDILNGKYSANLSTMSSRLSSYKGQDSELLSTARTQLKKYEDTVNQLSDHFNPQTSFKMNDEEIVDSFNEATNAAERFRNTMVEVNNTTSKSLGLGVAERSANKVAKYMNDNGRALKKYGAELTDLENRYRHMTSVGEKADLDNSFNNLKAKISAEGLTGKTVFEDLKRGAKQIFQFVSTYGLYQKMFDVGKQMIQNVVNIDTAMTNLKKVSDASSTDIANYFDSATVSAKKYGAEISDVINSTADWSRLGYNLKDSAVLSDATTLLQRVGDNMTQESASQGLISILKGFNKDVNEVNSIVDVINQAANTEPIDTAGIVAALERSASSLSASGNDLNQSISMITAANSVVQDSDSVGMFVPTLKIAITVKLLGRTRPWKDHNIYNNLLKLRQGVLKIA